jgi:hypothetical protein
MPGRNPLEDTTMKKLFGLLLVLALTAAACGDDDGGGSYDDPASIGDCDGLLDAGFDLLQDTLDATGDLGPEALASDEPPPIFVELEATGEALEARAQELGCSPADLDAGIVARVGDLDVDDDNIIGQFILEGIRSGSGGFFDG